ncbi:MAG TPA: transglutaminase-like domain-containing protein, partial [Rudaea sp.]
LRTAAKYRLDEALTALRSSRLLVDARIERIDRLVAAKGMPSLAASRWSKHRGAVIAAIANLDAAAEQSAQRLAAAPADTLPSFDALQSLIDAEATASAPPIYGAQTLPVYRPRLAARDPSLTPIIVPTYADAAHDNAPVAADYAATLEAPLSPTILDEAQQLGHDYTRIVDFVRSQVRTQWYAGAQKSAETTLRTLAGNDVDQASLLIALLRASGAAARYVRGVVDVPSTDLASMLGMREDEVGLALAAAGVPNRPVVSAGRISAYAIEHIYVSAYLPFSNYRGTAGDLDGRAWIPLAPALKPHAFTAAGGALARTGIAVDPFITQYLSAVQTSAPLDLLRQQVSDGLSHLTPPVTYASQLAQLSVSAAPLELLPASLPVAVEAVTGEFAALPETLRQHAHVVMRAGTQDSDAIVLDQTIPLAQLLDRRVTLAYEPASIDDGRIADQNGGFGAVPPYLVHVRPVLDVAGLPSAAGTGEIENGATHRVEITFDSPGGTASFAQNVTAGGLAAIVLDEQGDAPPQQADGVVLPGESETAAARLLANFGARYLATWDQADDELARLVGVGLVRPFPSAALVINQYTVDRVGGVVDAMTWWGVGLDAALRPVEPFTQLSSLSTSADWLELSSLQGSVLEHQIFEQQWSVDSISADKGLAVARANGQTVLTLTQATGASSLNQPQAVKDAIAAWLNRGYVVDVPRDPITYVNWTGAVWRVRSLSTGEAGYFISGALAGGSTAMPPELWYFQDLVELLGNPYGEEPDEDPQSGVALTLDATAQYQDGVVGTVLAQPLRATVVDAAGRPVLNTAVQFAVTTGTGKLVDAGGAESTLATVLTDRNGNASVRVHLGTSQGDRGVYRLDANHTYPQFVGETLVEVTAASAVGPLHAGEPYVEYSLPGAPSQLALVGSDGATLNPGMSYNAFAANLTDQYGNGVSNVAINLNASTQYTMPTCGNSDAVDTIDATLFVPGQCPSGAVQLTGNACASPALSTLSRPGGAPFFVVPPKTALATVTIAGSAGSASASRQLVTDAIYDPCTDSTVDAVTLWAHSPQFGFAPLLGEYLSLIDAAAPGQVMAASQRIDAFHADLVAGAHAGVNWQPIDNATFDPHLQNGSLENVHAIGGGSYLQDLRAGTTPGPVHGQIYLQTNGQHLRIPGGAKGLPNKATFDPNDLVFAWSVAVQAPQVTPSPIPLTPFSATDAQIHIAAQVQPNEYVAAPATIDLLQGDEVLQSCTVPILDVGELACDFARGMLVDTAKQYSVRVVLNDGTPFRFESARTQLAFGQGIIGGYGMLPHSVTGGGSGSGGTGNDPPDVVQELALVQGRFPKKLSVNQAIDIPSGYACTAGAHFDYLL